MDSMYQQLMQLPLFQGVSTDKITELVEKLPFHFLKYKHEEQVFAQGDSCTHIRFIVSGKVRLETLFPHLRITMWQTISSPHVLAPEYLFGRETVYPYTAVSEGGCGILQLRKSDYVKMINTDKVFLFNILNYLSSGSQRNLSIPLSISDGSVAERLAALVDIITVNGATDISFSYKQRDMCALLGIQRVTMISALERLSEMDILKYDTNGLSILDQQGLLRIRE